MGGCRPDISDHHARQAGAFADAKRTAESGGLCGSDERGPQLSRDIQLSDVCACSYRAAANAGARTEAFAGQDVWRLGRVAGLEFAAGTRIIFRTLCVCCRVAFLPDDEGSAGMVFRSQAEDFPLPFARTFRARWCRVLWGTGN